jgi:hypothetical protein
MRLMVCMSHLRHAAPGPYVARLSKKRSLAVADQSNQGLESAMHGKTNSTSTARCLVVADWAVDPYAVVAALRRRAAEEAAAFALVVPAWLHGLDWVGDPAASVPCAQRQLEKLVELSSRAGLDVEVAHVGDPDVISAIGDALDARDATEILLFERRCRFGRNPLDLVHRAQRATGLGVRRIEAGPSQGPRGRHGWALLRGGGHCDAGALQAA